ncbi:MAG: DUF5069 domain-containing protein [Candidatus Latescibacteria bacterium]|jgi:hypothetical protein|nr:DUF5069 domain-containing protein [Candidatus Latescibacterota bacterium]
MDLTRQPPRRPSNTCVAGIVNLARMTDKARAHNDETIGEFIYGADSGLDMILLDFLGISPDDFADAADRYDDEEVGRWVRQVSDRTDDEIDAFNSHHIGREPDDEAGKKRLRDRLEKYAPGRTDIKTVFQSIELDDWAGFWPVDLTVRAPRSPFCRDVAGVFGCARMADKGRADRAGTPGEYKYNCPIDQVILEFLGIAAEGYQEAACANPNDLELGAWILENTSRTTEEMLAFNARSAAGGPESEEQQTFFREALANAAPDRTDVTTWFDLLDVDDEATFGTVDLTRHAPRSPYDRSAGGICELARMIDKGRAFLGGTLGDYWYGDDSGLDRKCLEFLGISVNDFAEALKKCATDDEVLAWLESKGKKTEAEISAFNDMAERLGAGMHEDLIRERAMSVDPSRTDINTWFAVVQLDDRVSIARRKAGV